MPLNDTPTETRSSGIHPVDQRLPHAPTVLLGLQHVLVIGISLMKVPIEWSAGGSPTLLDDSPNPDFGKPIYLRVSLLQLSLI
jgi:xanthine/uracil permease